MAQIHEASFHDLDEETAALIIQLQIEDADSYSSNSKGKGREGDVLDEALAFNLQKEELKKIYSFLSDKRMTQSIASAVQNDGPILSDVLLREDMVASDRLMARRLVEGVESSNTEFAEVDPEANILDDELLDKLQFLYVSRAGESLLQEHSDREIESSDGGQAESSAWAASRAISPPRRCEACREEKPFFDLARVPCRHEYCRDCLGELFHASMTDESLFPPRCCGQPITVARVRIFLKSKLVQEFEKKKIELETPNRTYCWVSTCSAFIHTMSIDGDVGACQDCGERTCITYLRVRGVALVEVAHSTFLKFRGGKPLVPFSASQWTRTNRGFEQLSTALRPNVPHSETASELAVRESVMAEQTLPFRPQLPQGLQKASSSSSIADMQINESQKLRVLVASNGSRDVAQALALVVRLSKNPKIETRAIVDEESWPAHRLSQETLTLQNKSFMLRETDEAQKNIERQQIEFFHQQAFDLCGWADMLVMAPIDADKFAKMLHGISDCLLLEILRGWDVSKKIILVPGMTTSMWEHPMTKKQLNKVRRKWQWVRVMQPILWHYEAKSHKKLFVDWEGFNELVDVIKNQAELMTIGHDVDIAASGSASLTRYNMKTDALLPPELWSYIFEFVGDWEVSRALDMYANIPTPPEWQPSANDPKDELAIYMRSLEWTILTCPIPKIIDKLKQAPEGMRFLSPLCVKLIIKFCLTGLLTYMETNLQDVFWQSFGQKLLPIKASAVYGRTEILEWWRTSPTFLSKDYTAEAIDGASKSGFIHVLDWWRKSGLPLKYTELALEQASSKGHILALEWWKQASTHQSSYHLDSERRIRHGSPSRAAADTTTPPEPQPALQLKPGKSLLAAAQNNQPLVLRWWDNSGIPISHSESVAKIASAHGHMPVLDAWRELKGEKLVFDCQILVAPTKNAHVEVLQWWKNYSREEDGRPGGRVEYKTCDIEEALEDSVGSAAETREVKKWWARNGLNLGVEVSEWTKVKAL
ncbi:hypothetical protein B7494_g6206 [Chlorociboria aeruginascens]|nr:hypothetical protein B7494_g6206 [Chlorociboria aeruginascens]